jgi:iron-sulfur cluster repair protein YtfE (RIC family)
MHANEHLLPLIQSVGDDHAMIHLCIENYQKLCASNGPADRKAALAEIRKIINGALTNHFKMEEERIFPALAKAYPTAYILGCIDDLEMEHKEILEQAATLNALLDQEEATQDPDQNLNRLLMGFFIKFGHHALDEDALFAEVTRLMSSAGEPLSSS